MSNGKNLKNLHERIGRNRRRTMSTLRSENEKVIAILLADIHLSLNPPIWRSAEPDWLEAQARPLEEIKLLQNKCECPIFCVGDIFDKWNCSPELINWAIEHLPEMYAIPGQHDLPLHQYEDIHRSAYLTLVKAGKIINVEEGNPLEIEQYKIKLYGFPFGIKLVKCYDKIKDWIHIALIHDYFWIENKRYPEAPEERHISHNKRLFLSYDMVVIGDNHQSFLTEL